MFKWSVANKLPLNLSKCCVMHMTRSGSPKFCSSYEMGDATLDEVSDFKLLGVTFSKDLSFNTHINSVANKIAKLSGFIIRCTRNMSSAALLNLFKSLVLPHVVYCICVWAPFQGNHIDRLDRVQRKITRVVFYRKSIDIECRPSYEERLTDLGLLKFEDSCKFLRLVFCFKLINGLLPESFGQMINSSRINNSRLLHVTARSSSFFNSLFVSLPRLWNGIPSAIKDCTEMSTFKSECKSFFLDLYS